MKLIYSKSKWYLLTGILIACIAIYGCTKGFDKANKDPNTFPGSVVEPSFLLPGVYKASTLDPGMHERMTQLTNDIFGDIPYFKAADGTGENAPYDKQELIYKDMFKELKEASAALSTSNPKQQPGQDYVYNDDITKWKKFANSLRLRLALRVSQADAALSKQNAEEAIAAEEDLERWLFRTAEKKILD